MQDHIEPAQKRLATPGVATMTGYVPALDGIRAIAVLLVFLFHAGVPGFGAGFLGVDVFFVLSGFLITSLLLVEIDRTGTLDYRAFMRRRMARLMPALLAMVVVFVALARFFPVEPDVPLLQGLLVALYLADYSVPLADVPVELRHAWSLAVEAKFYLIWPVVVLVLARKIEPQRLWRIIALLALVAALWRVGNAHLLIGWDITYYRFDTRLSGLLAGAALASAFRSGLSTAGLRWIPWLSVLSIAVLSILPMEWGDKFLLIWGCTLYEAATLIMIVAVVGRPGIIARGLSFGPLVWLGKLSYGFYLWHYPVIRWLRDETDWQGAMIVGFPVSLLLAWFSFVTVERVAQRFRAPPRLAAEVRARS